MMTIWVAANAVGKKVYTDAFENTGKQWILAKNYKMGHNNGNLV